MPHNFCVCAVCLCLTNVMLRPQMVQTDNGLRWNLPLRSSAADEPPYTAAATTAAAQIGAIASTLNSTALTLSVCRNDCCNAGGHCLQPVLLPWEAAAGRASTPQRPCETLSDVVEHLRHGAWRRQQWVSSVCTLPRPSARGRLSVLFIGDSTVEEHAVMAAYTAGGRWGSFRRKFLKQPPAEGDFSNLCRPTFSDYRTFDATLGRSDSGWNVSGLWAGSVKCEVVGGEGIEVVRDAGWRNNVTEKVRTMQGGENKMLVFGVPSSHSCRGDLGGRGRHFPQYSCLESLEEYLKFMTQLLPHDRMAVLFTGISLERGATTSSVGFCNSFLQRNWRAAVATALARVAPGVPILDITQPTQSWLHIDNTVDTYRKACTLADRHLTCLTKDATSPPDAMTFGEVLEDRAFVTPPAKVAAQAISAILRLKAGVPVGG